MTPEPFYTSDHRLALERFNREHPTTTFWLVGSKSEMVKRPMTYNKVMEYINTRPDTIVEFSGLPYIDVICANEIWNTDGELFQKEVQDI